MRRLLALVALALPMLSCSDKKPSSIVIALSSEAPMPQTVDSVEIDVTSGGQTKFSQTYDVGAAEKLPGTLVVNKSEDTDDATPVTVRIIARHGGPTGMQLAQRSATLGFSDQKQKLLRMPIQFACFDVGCPDGQTCRAGACEADAADIDALPDFSDDQVFPVAGECFDRAKCITAAEHDTTLAEFQAKVAADPTYFDREGCTIPADQSEGANVNMGFVWSMNPTGKWTAVDFDADEGWQFSDATHTRIKMAKGLCEELKKDAPRIAKVVTASGCPPKPPTQPECAPAAAPTTTGTSTSTAPTMDAGADGTAGSGGASGGGLGASGSAGAAGAQ